MNITLNDTGKRFNRDWIFKTFNYDFLQGNTYAITGTNGSGKSTLLQVIAGAILQSQGSITYLQNEHIIASEKAFQQIAIAAPYLDLIEELTANEFLEFHSSFKKLTAGIDEVLNDVGLLNAKNKQIRYFSSGMKQRLKLAQAFFSDTSVLLLDEPTTNLDSEGIKVYKNLWDNNTKNKLVIVSSNDNEEYEKCNKIIKMGDYK